MAQMLFLIIGQLWQNPNRRLSISVLYSMRKMPKRRRTQMGLAMADPAYERLTFVRLSSVAATAAGLATTGDRHG